LAEDYHTRLYF